MLEILASWVEKRRIDVNKGGFGNDLTNKFGLGYVGCGMHRWVYKKRGTRKVYKITNLITYNMSEYAMYYGLSGTKLQSLLAKCYNISNNGMVLEQEYCPKKIPELDRNGCGKDDWMNLIENLGDCLAFTCKITKDKKYLPDLHSGNIMLTSKYDAKIIDYESLLYPLPELPRFCLSDCIKTVNRVAKKNDRDVNFFMNYNKEIVLDLGHTVHKAKTNGK